jgi:two-component system cell cycle sensor histidine kinase/response regulator CckA
MGIQPETGRRQEEPSLETQLARADANFLHLLDEVPDAIVVHRDNRIRYANDSALKLFGYARADVIGRSPFDFVSPRFRLLVAERILQTYVKHGVASEIEERLLHSSGREIPVEVIGIPVLFEGQLSTLVHMRDISMRKQLEVRLRAADRLANVGLIAASVAHEVNNPLTYALWNLDLLAARLERTPSAGDLDEINALLATARDGVARAASVARDVKVFSGAERTARTRVDIHRVLDSCANLVRSDMRGRVRLVKDYGEIPPVLGNETRIAQVLLNLVANAVQAIPDDERRGHEVTFTTQLQDGHVVVSIHDTGIGIPPELREMIFEPLFTTKQRGSGLGLSISRALVAEEHGTLSFDSEVGRGTTFTLELPAAARSEPPIRESRQPRTNGKRILVVDDEPNLAATLAMILDRHVTTIASSGREALAILADGPAFDVVLCDLSMDDVDGMELFAQIRAQNPALASRVIFLTGGPTSDRAAAFLDAVPNRRLEKPFDPDTLLDAVDYVSRESSPG